MMNKTNSVLFAAPTVASLLSVEMREDHLMSINHVCSRIHKANAQVKQE